MQLTRNIILSILIILAIHSCIEPFKPGTTDYEDMIVIEGYVSDEPGYIHYVKLSRTKPVIEDEDPQPTFIEAGATVYVECDDGTSYHFYDMSNGSYYEMDMSLIPESGKSYRLNIITGNGEEFRSDYQKYSPMIDTDSITWQLDRQKPSELAEAVDGIQFYVHASSDVSDPIYLRWSLDATYKYDVPFMSDYVWQGSLVEYENDTEVTCWKTIPIRGIYFGSSAGLSQNRVTNARLNFQSQYGYELSNRYSLHARQYSISESAYKFWYDLNEITNETGGLYETIPFPLEGNIKCISDPNIKALGVFEVSAMSEYRTFVNKPVELNVIPPYCFLDTVGTERLPWDALDYGAYIDEVDDNLYMTAIPECFICSLLGGSTTMPSFWVN